jgi:DNA polymerase-4
MLKKRGIETLGDIAALTFEQMWEWMDGYGMVLWERANGIDRSPVQAHASQRKSISEENTFEHDIQKDEVLTQEAHRMLKSLCFRLRRKSLYAKTLTLKVRYHDFQTTTHQTTLERPSYLESEFLPALKGLFRQKQKGKAVRLIGVGLSHLQNKVQLELFGTEQGEKKTQLQKTLDGLREKYGEKII